MIWTRFESIFAVGVFHGKTVIRNTKPETNGGEWRGEIWLSAGSLEDGTTNMVPVLTVEDADRQRVESAVGERINQIDKALSPYDPTRKR